MDARRGSIGWYAVGLAAALLLSAPLGAQGNRRTTVTVTGLPLSVTQTTTTDFDAGSVAIGSISIAVDLTTNTGAGGFSPRVTAVNIRCGPTCTGNFARIQWRRADLGTWNPLTTSFVNIETRTATFNGTNDPWSNTVFFRYQLAYASDPPSGPTQHTLEFQLVVTAP